MSNGNWIPDAVWDFIPPTGLAGGIFVGDREVLAVVVGDPNAATVNIEPINPSVIVPTVINFVATAVGAGTITYQWELDGVPIAGATTSVYDRTTVIGDDGKVITCKVTDGLGAQATSAPSTMTVALPVPPTITIAPIDPAVFDGDVIPFVATTTGTGVVVNTPTGAAAITLQWNLDGVPISGQQSSTYNRTTVLADNGKVITCTVTDTAGQSVESLPSTMTVDEVTWTTTMQNSAADDGTGQFISGFERGGFGSVSPEDISAFTGESGDIFSALYNWNSVGNITIRFGNASSTARPVDGSWTSVEIVGLTVSPQVYQRSQLTYSEIGLYKGLYIGQWQGAVGAPYDFNAIPATITFYK